MTSLVQTNCNTLELFVKKLVKYAEEYHIHFVITSRSSAVENENVDIPSIQISSLDIEEQDSWVNQQNNAEDKNYWLKKSEIQASDY